MKGITNLVKNYYPSMGESSKPEKSENANEEFHQVNVKAQRSNSLYSNSSDSAVSEADPQEELGDGWEMTEGNKKAGKYPQMSEESRMLKTLTFNDKTNPKLSYNSDDSFDKLETDSVNSEKDISDFEELPEMKDEQKYKLLNKVNIPDQPSKTQFKSEVELLNAMFSSRPDRVSMEGINKAFSDTFGKEHLSSTIESIFSNSVAARLRFSGTGGGSTAANPLGQFFSEIGTSKKTGLHKIHDFFVAMHAGRVAMQSQEIQNLMPGVDKSIKQSIDDGDKPDEIKNQIKRRCEIISRPLIPHKLKSGKEVEKELKTMLKRLPDQNERDRAETIIEKIRFGDKVQAALVGFPGTGKTTFWEGIFKVLDVPYVKMERPESLRDLLKPQSFRACYLEDEYECPALIEAEKNLTQIVSPFAAAVWRLPPGGVVLIDEGVTAFNSQPDIANTNFDMGKDKLRMVGFDTDFNTSLALTGNVGLMHGGLRDRINELFNSPPAAVSRYHALSESFDKALDVKDKTISGGKLVNQNRYSDDFKENARKNFQDIKDFALSLDNEMGLKGVRFLQQVGRDLPVMCKQFNKKGNKNADISERLKNHIRQNILPSYAEASNEERLFGASKQKDD